MQFKDYVNPELLNAEIGEGFIDVRRHPILPLSIYCYSRKATYENHWNEATTKCRGLIVDDRGEVIARPFIKFFNFGDPEHPETIPDNWPDTPVEVLDKLDGSLGILWEYTSKIDGFDTYHGIASKGSFTSDYAKWATLWYHANVVNPVWPEGYTPIFEMICQSIQTHVVLYDIPDQLILTALINVETGEELNYATLVHYAELNNVAVVERFTELQVDRPNKEGYVFSMNRPGQPPIKVKVKHPTFLKLQKIVHAATPKKILEALIAKDYNTIQAWEDGLSFELAEYVRSWRDKFTGAYGYTLTNAKHIFNSALCTYITRKDFATFFLNTTNKKYSSVLFAMLDGQERLEKNLESVSKAAWKIVAEEFKNELDKVREDE